MTSEPNVKLDGKRIPLKYDPKTKRYTAVVCVDTSEQEVSLSCVDLINRVDLHNMDKINAVYFGSHPSEYACRINAGQAALLSVGNSATILYMKAKISACKVMISLDTSAMKHSPE